MQSDVVLDPWQWVRYHIIFIAQWDEGVLYILLIGQLTDLSVLFTVWSIVWSPTSAVYKLESGRPSFPEPICSADFQFKVGPYYPVITMSHTIRRWSDPLTLSICRIHLGERGTVLPGLATRSESFVSWPQVLFQHFVPIQYLPRLSKEGYYLTGHVNDEVDLRGLNRDE